MMGSAAVGNGVREAIELEPAGGVVKKGCIAINGKFLASGHQGGVPRVAARYADLLTGHARESGYSITTFAPAPAKTMHALEIAEPMVVPGRFGTGQGWEAITLPRLARDSLLVSLCNLAPLSHRRSVVLIHDAQAFLCPDDYSRRQLFAFRTLLSTVARRAQLVVTISCFAKESLLEHGIGTDEKVTVIRNGTDHIKSVQPDSATLTRHGLSRDDYVMVLGSTKKLKNVDRVFDAFRGEASGLPRLVVVGGPPRSAYERRGWEPPRRTVFTGHVSDGELRALYEGASVFVMPSLTEGLGLPPIEAMHCATPVVASSAGALPETCGDAAVLVDPHDTSAWSEAIGDLVGLQDLRETQVSRGHARASELSWSAAGRSLWKRLEPLV